MIVFTLVFNKLLGVGSPGGNYVIFSFAGLLYWTFFANSFQNASSSIVSNQALITKIYFPRIIAPIASTLVSFVDFAFGAIVLVGLMVFYRVRPDLLGVALVLPMLLVAFLWSDGLGTFFAAVNVRYRDVKYVLPFLVQTLLFLTPVIYPLTFIPERFQLLTYLNPMTGVITAIRAELVHQGTVSWTGVALSSIVAVLAAVFATRYFIRAERRFADIV
jgi:lipopolysaccharide transport system permease protein